MRVNTKISTENFCLLANPGLDTSMAVDLVTGIQESVENCGLPNDGKVGGWNNRSQAQAQTINLGMQITQAPPLIAACKTMSSKLWRPQQISYKLTKLTDGRSLAKCLSSRF